MTQKSNTTTGNARESNPPVMIAYAVSDRGRGRKFWTRLGSVWEHKKGEGLTVYLNVLPVDFDGRIVLMPPREQDDEQTQVNADTAGEAADDEIPV